MNVSVIFLKTVVTIVRLIPDLNIPGLDHYDGLYYYVDIVANSFTLLAALLLMYGLA